MVLEPPESVRKLQRALQTKAKGAPDYRFYLLYDKLYRKDVLEYAYDRCKANEGAPGVDGQDFADIETYGEERWIHARHRRGLDGLLRIDSSLRTPQIGGAPGLRPAHAASDQDVDGGAG